MLDTTAKDAAIVRWSLLDLTQRDYAELPNGCGAYVVSEGETYRLDTSNSFVEFSPLIIGRTVGNGRWFKRSKAYVVSNFTLWVQGFNAKNYALGYTPGQLLASGTVQADIVLGSADNSNSSESAVVDGNGNLWWNIGGAVAGKGVSKIALKDTLATGAPTPSVKIDSGTSVNMAAFDKSNSLWTENASTVFKKFSAAQYGNSGTPTPIVTVTQTGVTGPINYMLFDDRGNLWGSSFVGNTVFMMLASQLLTSASVAMSVIWAGSNTAGATGIAFGPTGLLWVGGYAAGAGTVKAFDPTNPVSGNPAPTIALTSTSFVGVEDIAFDAAGNLWVLNFDNKHLIRIPAASLGASGAVVPDVDILIQTPTGAPSAVNGMNFSYNPNRSGLLPSGGPPIP